jgi:starch synthase
MAGAELAPLVKVGGLGDVVGSLPPALAKLGCDVRIIIPKYGNISEKHFKLKKVLNNIEIPTANKIEKINLWQTNLPGTRITIYLVEADKYFGDKNPYAGNNSEKFLFFSLAVMHLMPEIKFIPDVLHCHDFHVAMLIDLLKVENLYSGIFKNVKTLYTIHNLNFQGQTGIETLRTGNLNKDMLISLSVDAQNSDINYMVQGIISADLVNTVSPTYAKEIKTSVYGAGLERVIKQNQDKISGILNGIDMDFFNPAKDELIFRKYDLKNKILKIKNKKSLFNQLKINSDENEPLVALVSRFSWQKGLDLINENLLKLPARFVFLGTGEKKYEDNLKYLEKNNSDKFKVILAFDEKMAHQIYAASDIFLVPSRFEPCGLTQMIAMRYGAVPVVRATGGLADTVDKEVGFIFKKFEAKELEMTLAKALKIYKKRPEIWSKMQIQGMKRDFSWNKSAKEYVNLYNKMFRSK